MELPGLNPLGSLAAFAVEAPMRKLQIPVRVEPSDQTRGGAADTHQRPEQDIIADEARDVAALRREMQHRDLPAGPPPAFQISLLEAEGGLEQVLARIEATRSQERDAPALRPANKVQQASAGPAEAGESGSAPRAIAESAPALAATPPEPGLD